MDPMKPSITAADGTVFQVLDPDGNYDELATVKAYYDAGLAPSDAPVLATAIAEVDAAWAERHPELAADPAPEPEPVDYAAVVAGTVAQVLAWVADHPEQAQAVYETEMGSRNRSTLTGRLEADYGCVAPY